MNSPLSTPRDMRSPLKSVPNTGTRPGYPGSQARFFMGEIVNPCKDPNGIPNLTFDVLPLVDGAPGPGMGGIQRAVPLSHAGFSNIGDIGRSPSGIVYVPEVGSLVICTFCGSRFYITGCLSGPSKGDLTRVLDKEGSLVTFQPGLEYGLNRLIAPAKYDIPWLYGYGPGDTIIGKDYVRVKLCDRGLILSGCGPACVTILKADGERLDRYTSQETRAVGFWSRHNFTRGTELADSQYQKDPTLANPPLDGSAYQCQVMETTPYMAAKSPYMVTEHGHISRNFTQMGRSAIYATASSAVILEEKKAENYAVSRFFIATPVAPQPSPTSEKISERVTSQQSNELRKSAYERCDLQLDVDGSFRLRTGNTSKKPGGQEVKSTQELDLSCEYISKSLAFLFRIGKAGALKTDIKADPASITVHTTTLTEKIEKLIDTTARQSITQRTKKFTVRANEINLVEGPVDIERNLKIHQDCNCSKTITAEKDVVAEEKSIALIKFAGPKYTKRLQEALNAANENAVIECVGMG